MSKEIAVHIAWSYLGLPYRWAGDDPIQGFDCSGMCVEILKSVGVLPRKGDWTAHGLYRLFSDKEIDDPKRGCLIFYGSKSKITHVEFAITDELTIGASGGGSRTLTEQNAVDQNAFIKVRPWANRGGSKFFVDPFME